MDPIKPQDFLDQIPKPQTKQSLSILRREKLQKGRNIIPKQAGSCSSCLFRIQGCHYPECTNRQSDHYGYKADREKGCKFYVAQSF